jgi:hypothetical protein
MRSVRLAQLPLALDALTFGELVHELLGRSIDALEPAPGFVRASRDEIETALAGAVAQVAQQWPLEVLRRRRCCGRTHWKKPHGED